MNPIFIYNTKNRRKEEFRAIEPGNVGIYVCGITAYDDPHIGHARCYVAFDTIVRHLSVRGYKVKYIRNITDLDDKIIKRSFEKNMTCKQLTELYIKSFDDDMEKLNVLNVDFSPRVTEHISEIIVVIKKIIDAGYAYQVENGVYFSVRKFVKYGNFSAKDVDKLYLGARVCVDNKKRDPLDFALWKISKRGEPSWESPWGLGRPGWHIECSVMSTKYLGNNFDIHGGGKDLIFPHHENEIAQAEVFTGESFANYWMHNGFVRIDKEKMSKSLGNFLTIKDILKEIKPEVLRLFLLSKHYRSPLDFNYSNLLQTSQSFDRLYRTLFSISKIMEDIDVKVSSLKSGPWLSLIKDKIESFEKGMDNDFNFAIAVASLFSLVRIFNKMFLEREEKKNRKLLLYVAKKICEFGNRLGILNKDPFKFLDDDNDSEIRELKSIVVKALIEERGIARKVKNYKASDQIRDYLKSRGVILEDTVQGTRWFRK